MIAVIARRQEDTVYIQVEDNGVGMTDGPHPSGYEYTGKHGSAAYRSAECPRQDPAPFRGRMGIHIESEPGMGTQIIMRFPARENASDPQNSRDTKKEKTC